MWCDIDLLYSFGHVLVLRLERTVWLNSVTVVLVNSTLIVRVVTRVTCDRVVSAYLLCIHPLVFNLGHSIAVTFDYELALDFGLEKLLRAKLGLLLCPFDLEADVLPGMLVLFGLLLLHIEEAVAGVVRVWM